MITAAQVRAAGGQVAVEATAFDAAAARHTAAARAVREAVSRVREGWTSQAAAPVVAALEAEEHAHGQAADALEAAAGSLRRLARTAEEVARALVAAEQDLSSAEAELDRRSRSSDPSELVAVERCRSQVGTARRAIERHQATWSEDVRTTTREVEAAADAVETTARTVAVPTTWGSPAHLLVGSYLASRTLVRAGTNLVSPAHRGRGINVRNPLLWTSNRVRASVARMVAGTRVAGALGLHTRLRSVATTLGRRSGAHKMWTGRRGFVDAPVTTRGQRFVTARQGLATRAGSVVSSTARKLRVPGAVTSAVRAAAPVVRRVPVLGTALSLQDVRAGRRDGDGLQVAAGVTGIVAGAAVGVAVVAGAPAIVATATALTVGAAALSVGSSVSRWWKGRS